MRCIHGESGPHRVVVGAGDPELCFSFDCPGTPVMDDELRRLAASGLDIVAAGCASLAAQIRDKTDVHELTDAQMKMLVMVMRNVAYDLGLTTRP